MTTPRYTLQIAKDSNDTFGWNGWVKDHVTGKRYELAKVTRNGGAEFSAFNNRQELVAAARRQARILANAA